MRHNGTLVPNLKREHRKSRQPHSHGRKSFMLKLMRPLLAAATTVSSLIPVQAAETYGSVEAFYDYITAFAQDAGFDMASLPTNPTATYKQSVTAYFWVFRCRRRIARRYRF